MPRFIWTKEKVIAKLRELQSNGEDITPKRLFAEHGGLYYAGRRLFGGTTAMYLAACVSLDILSRKSHDYWTKDRIVAELKSLYMKGEDMSYSRMIADHSSLYAACTSKFERYSKALEAAEIPYDRFRREHIPWTDEEIIRTIRNLWTFKVDLSSSNVMMSEPSLYVAAQRRYGSWFTALTAADIPADRYRKLPERKKRLHLESWTNAKVIEEIKKLDEKGEELSHSAVLKNHPALEGAARARFGNSWHEAVEAAGIDSAKSRKQRPPGYWTKNRIITELQIMYADKEDLKESAVREKRSDLHSRAQRYFGGYYSGLIAAGIPVEDYRRYRPEGYWSKSKVIEELKQLHALGVDLSYSAMEEFNNALVHGATRAFGKYENAFVPAGLDYEKIRKDKMMEAFVGRVFERYLEEMMGVLRWNVRPQQSFRIGGEVFRPDFVDSETGFWIDAKVDSWSPGVAVTILKYSVHCDKVIILYLKGKKRKWVSDDAEIRPVSDYYSLLVEIGREDLVRDFEKLKKGIVRPELQTELERFSKGFDVIHKQV